MFIWGRGERNGEGGGMEERRLWKLFKFGWSMHCNHSPPFNCGWAKSIPAICVPGRLLTRAASWKMDPPSPHNTWPAQTLHGWFLWKRHMYTHMGTHAHTFLYKPARATFGFVILMAMTWWLKELWWTQTAQNGPKQWLWTLQNWRWIRHKLEMVGDWQCSYILLNCTEK